MDALTTVLVQRLGASSDLEHKRMENGSMAAELIFIQSLCDSDKISRFLVEAFYRMADGKVYESYIRSFPGCKPYEGEDPAVDSILKGSVAISIHHRIYLFDAADRKTSSISEAKNETTVQGPHDALTENTQTNLNMIRNRYRSDSLLVESHSVGKTVQVSVTLLYDNVNANGAVIGLIRGKLLEVKEDILLLQSVSELMKRMSDRRISIFPMMMTTERPDRIVKNLAEGKIVLLVDGVPIALVGPASFFDFFATMDDQIMLPAVNIFLKMIRYLGFVLTLILPGSYVALTAFNPEVLRVQLAVLIAGSRAAVPYPAFLEVFIMLILMEFLLEASLRLPKAVGPTATTVGGLILGQAATEAGLVGNIMIILVALVGISNFVIPISLMNFSVRVLKYFFLVLAIAFGMLGIILGLIGLIAYLCNLRSLGTPYLRVSGLSNMPFKKRQQAKGE